MQPTSAESKERVCGEMDDDGVFPTGGGNDHVIGDKLAVKIAKKMRKRFKKGFKNMKNGFAKLLRRRRVRGGKGKKVTNDEKTTPTVENDKPLPTIGEIVYPITKEKDTISETSAHYHLNKLTEYYDTETREFKKQSKIIFNMNIISPKLDEVAKDQNVESGIEDSDVEMEKKEDEKDSVNGE